MYTKFHQNRRGKGLQCPFFFGNLTWNDSPTLFQGFANATY